MPFSISQTSEYALRSVVALGRHGDGPLTTQQASAETRIPAGYLSKLLQGLSRAGLVNAQRGLHGGYVLARRLDELTVLDVINAVDPIRRIVECPLGLAAHRVGLCSLHRRPDEVKALVESHFRATTIAGPLDEPGGPVDSLCEVPRLSAED
jgi:Rrf2 family transcriptional regulator, nitric oxide-sensitive transcriptional repressor